MIGSLASMNRAGFDFYEVVRVEPRSGSHPELAGIAAASARSSASPLDEGQRRVAYAVSIDGADQTWAIDGRDLVSTGEFRRREDYYDGTSIRVSVDGKVIG